MWKLEPHLVHWDSLYIWPHLTSLNLPNSLCHWSGVQYLCNQIYSCRPLWNIQMSIARVEILTSLQIYTRQLLTAGVLIPISDAFTDLSRLSSNTVIAIIHNLVSMPLSGPSSGPEFCVVWLRKMPASGWGSLWESSSFVPWFSTFVFRNVSGTVPECFRICGLKRNLSNLDRAAKMRDSVLLNSWDSFLVTLPSISSETCVLYSSLILGTDVFRDWPFLGCSSCVSLVTAANFRLFLNVAIFLKGKCYAVMKTEIFFICYSTWDYNKMLFFRINN